MLQVIGKLLCRSKIHNQNQIYLKRLDDPCYFKNEIQFQNNIETFVNFDSSIHIYYEEYNDLVKKIY